MSDSSPKPPRPCFVVSTPCCPIPHAKDRAGCAFQVAWSINPHMKIGATNPTRAARQHDTFVRVLARLGADVQRVPFVHGAYDSVFTKDNALLVAGPRGGRALLASPRYSVRRNEQGARRHALRGLGFEVSTIDSHLEGGDVVILPGGEAFLGHGFRSSPASAPALATFLGAPATALSLVDERLYHLDTALSVLDDGTALVCREAFAPESLRRISRHPSISRVIDVPLEEALVFAANAVQVGRAIVLGGPGRLTTKELERVGFETHTPELDEFRRAGGSAACLVARVHPTPSHADAVAAA